MYKIIIGLLISSVYSYFILPKNEGEEPSIKLTVYPIFYKGMIIIPYSKANAIHLHHWILYMFVCASSIFTKINEIILGFSLGLLIQGIQYKDSFHIICKNPY